MKEYKKRIIDLKYRNAGLKKRNIDLEYQNAGLNGLIDFMREEIAELQNEVKYEAGKAGRYSHGLLHVGQHHVGKMENARAIGKQKHKDRDKDRQDKYYLYFERIYARYLEDGYKPSKAWTAARNDIVNIIYGDECLSAGKQIYADFSDADRKNFDNRGAMVMKEFKKQIPKKDRLQFAPDVIDLRIKEIKRKVKQSMYRKLEKGTVKRIGRDKAKILFPMPK